MPYVVFDSAKRMPNCFVFGEYSWHMKPIIPFNIECFSSNSLSITIVPNFESTSTKPNLYSYFGFLEVSRSSAAKAKVRVGADRRKWLFSLFWEVFRSSAAKTKVRVGADRRKCLFWLFLGGIRIVISQKKPK